MKRILACFAILMVLTTLILGNYTDTYAQDGGEEKKLDPYTTGVFPRAMAYDGQRMWVANWLEDTISILDGRTGVLIKLVELDKLTAAGSTNDYRPVALAWDGTYMWVANSVNNTVMRLDAAGALQGALGRQEGIQQPAGLFFDGAHVWVINQGTGSRNGTLLKVEPYNFEVIGQPFQVGYFPTAMTWDGQNLWVANGYDNDVSIVDPDNGSIVARIPVGTLPMTITFDGIHMWVGHYDGTLTVINRFSREIDTSIELDEVEGRPIELLYAFERVWISTVNDGDLKDEIVTSLTALDGVLISNVIPGQFPATLGFTNHQVWVANWLDYKIYTVDVALAVEPGTGEGEGTTVAGNSGIEAGDTINEAAAVATQPSRWLPTPVATDLPTPTPTPALTCVPNMPGRLGPGMRGRIDAEGDTSNLALREGVGTDQTLIERFEPGTEFEVIGGPECDDNNDLWVQVRLTESGQEGWFIEALDGDYTIEPIE